MRTRPYEYVLVNGVIAVEVAHSVRVCFRVARYESAGARSLALARARATNRPRGDSAEGRTNSGERETVNLLGPRASAKERARRTVTPTPSDTGRLAGRIRDRRLSTYYADAVGRCTRGSFDIASDELETVAASYPRTRNCNRVTEYQRKEIPSVGLGEANGITMVFPQFARPREEKKKADGSSETPEKMERVESADDR